jgi:hypothetical protein
MVEWGATMGDRYKCRCCETPCHCEEAGLERDLATAIGLLRQADAAADLVCYSCDERKALGCAKDCRLRAFLARHP